MDKKQHEARNNTEGEESKFNASDVLAAIQKARAVRRRRSTWQKSKLEKYLAELIQLKASGASLTDMQFWLLKEKRVSVVGTTIKRYLDKRSHMSGKD